MYKKRSFTSHSSGSNESRDGPRFDLPKSKKLSIREFKGSTLIDIREFYTDKDGSEKPGKKGISLTKEVWNALVEKLPEIQTAINKFEGKEEAADEEEREKEEEKEEEEEEEEEEEGVEKRKAKRIKKSKDEDSSEEE